jgi:uncharacterized protein (TIGR03032 family)
MTPSSARGTPPPPGSGGLELHTSRRFVSFLAAHGASLAISTYQANKLFLLGVRPDAKLSAFERTLPRCMGLAASRGALHVATLNQVWHFQDVVAGEHADTARGRYAGHDALYAPRRCWVTGDLDVHDLALLPDARPVFANTLFSCISTVSDSASFLPLWQPRFISRLAAEDRCHLNGLAMEDGVPRYATVVGPSDVADGWREHRVGGGVVLDIASGETVCAGLSMPHSPRLHGGMLYVLNSGTGEFGRIDVAAGRFEPIAFCPGYLRGLAFLGDHAVVGLSLPRDNRTFTGLPLDEALTSRGAEARCAVMVIDLATGDAVHWVRFDGVVKELYDVAVLPGVTRPAAIGFLGEDISRFITIGAPSGD